MTHEESCRFCGCTESRACPGGCAWYKPGYCTACADQHLERLAELAMVWTNPKGDQCELIISAGTFHIQEADESLAVRDHLGVVVFALTPRGCFIAPHYDAHELAPLFESAAP